MPWSRSPCRPTYRRWIAELVQTGRIPEEPTREFTPVGRTIPDPASFRKPRLNGRRATRTDHGGRSRVVPVMPGLEFRRTILAPKL